MSYICCKWRSGWILATEPSNDSENMTGLRRRGVQDIRKEKDGKRSKGAGSNGGKKNIGIKGCIY